MPQATDELRARWPGCWEAVQFLRKAGYTETKAWTWVRPKNHTPTDEELSAIDYLVFEWDWGGLEKET